MTTDNDPLPPPYDKLEKIGNEFIRQCRSFKLTTDEIATLLRILTSSFADANQSVKEKWGL